MFVSFVIGGSVLIVLLQGCCDNRYRITQTIDEKGTYSEVDSSIVAENEQKRLTYQKEMEEYKEAIELGYDDPWEPMKPYFRNSLITKYNRTTVITKVYDRREYETLFLSEVKYDEKLIENELRKAKKAIEKRKAQLEYLDELNEKLEYSSE